VEDLSFRLAFVIEVKTSENGFPVIDDLSRACSTLQTVNWLQPAVSAIVRCERPFCCAWWQASANSTVAFVIEVNTSENGSPVSNDWTRALTTYATVDLPHPAASAIVRDHALTPQSILRTSNGAFPRHPRLECKCSSW